MLARLRFPADDVSMNTTLTGALLAALGFASLASTPTRAADSPDGLWHEVNPSAIARNGRDREIVPNVYRAFELNRGRLTAALATAPREGDQQRPGNSKITVRLPLPGGGYGNFKIVESPVMEPALAAKYPDIKTYLGQDVDDKSTTVRFDFTPKGFHAQILSRQGTLYVDPFQPGDTDHYIAYRKADHVHGARGRCEVTGAPIGSAEDTVKHLGLKLSSGGTLRTYRLAMAATGEYTAFHGGTVADGLAAIVTTVNRVDGIYEREVSVRMVLVANEDQIIYTNAATDPYANDSGDLNANQSNTDSVIGSANYDIGHLVGTGGGGIAGLGVVCGSSKARGLTGSDTPIGDGYDVDYVAHEMGHQFGGNHTFNGSGGSCAGGNRSASHAYEPGSGITIQAYAGICGGDDLQPNSDDYFHRESLREIITYTTTGTGGTCGTTNATGNAIPSVTTSAAFTIPGQTPFTLTATGSDADSDPLTYIWEEYDLGGANAEGVLDPTVTAGPIFRSFDPVSDPSRTFPSWRYILDDANVVPPTITLQGNACPSGTCMAGEVLPNADRTMNFRVTVRDNKAGGGGTNEASTVLTVSNAGGPFALTSPNTAVTWASGSTQTVSWNVAGTAAAPISTANVKISLSTDGGNTFPIVLAASTPNDGSESVAVPNAIASTQARVKVEAVGNIFFDVSDADFTITDGGNAPPAINVTGSVATTQGGPTASAVVATVSDAEDAAGALTVSVSGAPPELSVSVSNSGGNVTLSATALCTLVAPSYGVKVYPVVLRVTDSAGAVRTAEIPVRVGANKTPKLGTYPTVLTVPGATRLVAPDALASDANGNLSGASVTPTTLPGGGTVGIASDGTVTITTTGSTTAGTYAVRSSVADTCGATETREFNVTVGGPVVTLNVASNQVTTGNGLIEPNECNSLDVAVRNDGSVAATNVSGTLTTTTGNVTITQATSAYPDIPAGASGSNLTSFQVSTGSSLTCFSNIAFTLTLSYTQAGSPATKNLNVSVGQPVGTNYVFTTSSGATLPNDGVLVAGSQADNATFDLIVPAGFNFSVYGTAVTGGTTLRGSTNGNLQLRPTQGATDAAPTVLPAVGVGSGQAKFPTAPTLFLQWQDWRMSAALGAGVYSKLQGTAPNREWIIEWRGRIGGDGATTTINNRAAIVLHENSNSFDYVYLLTGTLSKELVGFATIGVQSAATGTTFTQFQGPFFEGAVAPGTKLTAAIPAAVCNSGAGVCALSDNLFKDGFE